MRKTRLTQEKVVWLKTSLVIDMGRNKKYINETPEERRLRKNAYRRAWYAKHPEKCKMYNFKWQMKKAREDKLKEEIENGMAVQA